MILLLAFSQSSEIDYEKYEKNIRHNGYVLFDKRKFATTGHFCAAKATTLQSIAFNCMYTESGGLYPELRTPSIIDFLKKTHGCSDGDFNNRKTKGSESLDSKKVLKPLLERGYATEFLNAFIQYRSFNSAVNRVPTFLNLMVDAGDVSRDRRPLSRIYTTVTRQENNRYNYKEPDIVSLKREFKSTMAVEKGYCMVRADLAQSDFRIALNTMLLDEELVKHFSKFIDQYEALVSKVFEINEIEFSEELFKLERELYKLNALETLYGTKNKRGAHGEVVKRISKFYASCTRYAEYLRRVRNAITLGLPIDVTDYFGYVQTIGIDVRHPVNTENKCLNTPVQTGTSHIMILVVNKILDMFYDLGYTSEDVSVYMVRHDEVVFKVKIAALKDAWIFKSAETIQVDDWTPLAMEFSYGYNYTIDDPDLTEVAHASYESHGEYIEERINHHSKDFYPVKDTYIVSVATEVVGDKLIVVIYNQHKHQAKSFIINKEESDRALGAVHHILTQKVENLKDYTGVIVYNSMENKTIQTDGVFFKYSKNFDNGGKDSAYVLCHHIASIESKRQGLTDFVVNEYLLNINQKFIEGVKELDVLQT